MHPTSSHLALHGVIVLLFGMLLGEPYARAIHRKAAPHVIRAWRIAHFSLPIGATVMMAIAALLPSMEVEIGVKWVIAVGLIVASYGFCVATPLAAVTGQQGPAARATGLGRLAYAAKVIGASSALVATSALVYSAFVTL